MDFVARAKALLASKARIGLMILPLAAAVPATATVLPTSNFNCSLSGSPVSNCTADSSVAQLPLFNGIEGLKFFGPSSGAFAFNNISGGSGGSVTFSTAGFLSGENLASGLVIPVAYNFSLSHTGCCSFTGFSLTFNIFQPSGGSATVTITQNGNLDGQQTGTGNLNVSSTLFGNEFTFVTSTLSLTYSADGFFGGNLVIPQNSLDINPVADAGVPEPASVVLTGFGIALAGGFRLIRRRKGFAIVKDSEKA